MPRMGSWLRNLFQLVWLCLISARVLLRLFSHRVDALSAPGFRSTVVWLPRVLGLLCYWCIWQGLDAEGCVRTLLGRSGQPDMIIPTERLSEAVG
jgi:hypothetical protein